jgi:hypothetical protein
VLHAESTHKVLQSAPDASAAVRRFAAQWHEQSVLDPKAAEETAQELKDGAARAESVPRELLVRETAIATKLKTLVAGTGCHSGARRELKWRPKHDALQTLRETIAAERLDRFVR